MTTQRPMAADSAAQPEQEPLNDRVRERLESRVRTVDARDAIARLETYVRRMERRYEYTSEEMTERVRSGQQKCTREISLWLPRYRSMLRLREAVAAAL
ncbi:MAG: hypothetical protein OXC56_07090 [Chloroflexi bacterium]|nr:hypothetical protein [Chloroflexota bacterium]